MLKTKGKVYAFRGGFIYWCLVGLSLSCLSALFGKLYLKPVVKAAVEICSCLINEILAENAFHQLSDEVSRVRCAYLKTLFSFFFLELMF